MHSPVTADPETSTDRQRVGLITPRVGGALLGRQNCLCCTIFCQRLMVSATRIMVWARGSGWSGVSQRYDTHTTGTWELLSESRCLLTPSA